MPTAAARVPSYPLIGPVNMSHVPFAVDDLVLILLEQCTHIFWHLRAKLGEDPSTAVEN